ncbi:hypothetical protein X736_20415 [Mesorhizobium sp. L2C089B000]|nr:hypothetical protein X736_20415 [Mesorhizobium sp. L2C089B000]
MPYTTERPKPAEISGNAAASIRAPSPVAAIQALIGPEGRRPEAHMTPIIAPKANSRMIGLVQKPQGSGKGAPRAPESTIPTRIASRTVTAHRMGSTIVAVNST